MKTPITHLLRFIPSCLAMLGIFKTSQAQHYYPAGLGNGTLQLWLTAADPTTLLTSAGTQAVNGSSVATWTDKSGNGLNAAQSSASAQPVYATNQLNGLGGVLFQNNTQYMTGGTGSWYTIVTTRAMLGTGYQYLFSSPALADFSVRFTGGTTTVRYTDGPNGNDWDYNTGGVPTQWINGGQTLTGTTITHILVDESLNSTIGTYSLSSTFLGRGMYNNDPVYDLIVYGSSVNMTQRKLLENYEAALWGLTSYLPTPANTYPVFSPATANTYNRNLVGIGYSSASDNFLNDAVGSTDGLGFFSGTSPSDFLQNFGFIMAAHNGQTNTVNYNPTLNDVPVNSYVWNRTWLVEKFGGTSTGNVTLNFNFSDYNGTAPNPAYHFGILWNASDGTFSSGVNYQLPFVSTTVSGNIVAFVVNASNLPNGYFTLLSNMNNVLPITLEDFTVTKLPSDAAQVEWKVSPDFGNGNFSLERSGDGARFNTIGTIKADSNDAASQTYTYIDHSPLPGTNYYRLLTTDATGNTAYSQIVSVNFGQGSQPVTLYPSPATDVLHISAPGFGGSGVIDLFSSSGQLVASYPFTSLDGMSLSVGNLSKGSYFAQIRTRAQSFTLPFVKR
jgi:hypothetical protein